MHTAALALNGSIFTWGCNDDLALGRKGAENIPLKVEFDFQADDITAGDSHTIAYNKNTNQIFYWGCYRVSTFLHDSTL
jgi:regulator of chromosome condensation